MPFLTQGKTNWKYILILVILALIVGGGILGYRFYQYRWLPKMAEKELEQIVKEEVTNWEVYRNEEYGFEIKYPSNWHYSPNALQMPPSMIFCPPYPAFYDEVRKQCKIETGRIIGYAGPIDLFIAKWEDIPGDTKEEKIGGPQCEETESKIVNGIQVEIRKCLGRHAIWENPSGSYLYVLNLSDLYAPHYVEIFSKMLSTFRFLE